MFYPTYINETSAASIMYINGIEYLKSFINFVNLNKNMDDMRLLFLYRLTHSDESKYDLPVCIEDDKSSDIGVFDLISLGHYFFGGDKRILNILNKNLIVTNQSILNFIQPQSYFNLEGNALFY
jgi:hypothetical protein